MTDRARSKAQQDEALIEIIEDLSRQYERLQGLADRAEIGIRSALAREVRGLAEQIENLKGRAWDLRRRSNLLEAEFLEFERQCRELNAAMKALGRKIK